MPFGRDILYRQHWKLHGFPLGGPLTQREIPDHYFRSRIESQEQFYSALHLQAIPHSEAHSNERFLLDAVTPILNVFSALISAPLRLCGE